MFAINVTGSLLISVILTVILERSGIAPFWWLLSALPRGYTTFSSYSFEAVALMEQGWGRAVTDVIGSNVLGLLACYVGIVATRRVLM